MEKYVTGKNKRMKNIYHSNGNHKSVEMPVL